MSSPAPEAQDREEQRGRRRVQRRFLDAETRLRTRLQRETVRRQGRSRAERLCVVAAVSPPPDHHGRVAFVISKRYDKKAVVRNRARRLFRETYRRLRPVLKPAWIVFIPRYGMRKARLAEVMRDVEKACRTLGLIDADPESGARDE